MSPLCRCSWLLLRHPHTKRQQQGGFYSQPCLHPVTAGFARSGRRWHSRQCSAQ